MAKGRQVCFDLNNHHCHFYLFWEDGGYDATSPLFYTSVICSPVLFAEEERYKWIDRRAQEQIL